MWGSGNYAAVADKISAVGEHVVEAVGLEPGMEALDVACGSGNATIPAARAGARVTGADFSPDLLAIARERAADAMGFRHVESGPLVRSSYHAWSHVN